MPFKDSFLKKVQIKKSWTVKFMSRTQEIAFKFCGWL